MATHTEKETKHLLSAWWWALSTGLRAEAYDFAGTLGKSRLQGQRRLTDHLLRLWLIRFILQVWAPAVYQALCWLEEHFNQSATKL